MDLLGLKRQVININEIEPQKLMEMIKYTLKNKKAIKIKIKKEIDKAKINSIKNIDLIKNHFNF